MKLEGLCFLWEIAILLLDFDFVCLLVIDVSGLVALFVQDKVSDLQEAIHARSKI